MVRIRLSRVDVGAFYGQGFLLSSVKLSCQRQVSAVCSWRFGLMWNYCRRCWWWMPANKRRELDQP